MRFETLLAPTEDCCRVFELKVSASVSGCGLSSFQLLLKAPLCLNELLTLAPNQYQPNSLKNHRWNWPHCSVLSVPCDQCVCVYVYMCIIAASLPFPVWPASRELHTVMVEDLLSFMIGGVEGGCRGLAKESPPLPHKQTYTLNTSSSLSFITFSPHINLIFGSIPASPRAASVVIR